MHQNKTSALSDALTVPRAPSFIVTLYGDIVAPRAGGLWIGTLIECCEAHGLSEGLVRTAVSRLVSSGRLEGERIGRKSYYRLTDMAKEEFEAAARVLYAPPPQPTGWLVTLSEAETVSTDWQPIGPKSFIAPRRNDVLRPDAAVLSCDTVAGIGALRGFAAQAWPLAEVGAKYDAFLSVFAPILAHVWEAGAPPGPDALALRLQLVHAYRHAALVDPRLPEAALPDGWPGGRARALFVRGYLALTRAADEHVGLTFHDSRGLLAAATAATELREDRLRRELLS
ncbi:MAG: ArsR family transcriptional regulator [Rhodobacteraceae bacterium]|nr:ArsR family transcriptional regulator [Paracoccaceae bacterium]